MSKKYEVKVIVGDSHGQTVASIIYNGSATNFARKAKEVAAEVLTDGHLDYPRRYVIGDGWVWHTGNKIAQPYSDDVDVTVRRGREVINQMSIEYNGMADDWAKQVVIACEKFGIEITSDLVITSYQWIMDFNEDGSWNLRRRD